MMKSSVSDHARKLYEHSIVVDNAIGIDPEIEVTLNVKWAAIERFLKAGVTYAFLSVGTDLTSLERAVQFIALCTERIRRESDKYILVEKAEDISRAKKEKKLALSFMFQGTNPLAKDENMLEIYYRLGVRSMILAYNIRNPLGDGCVEARDAGLSELGVRMVEKMNRVGILIDCSHVGQKTSLEVMALSKLPVIFSHSCAYGVHPHPRNITDEQIRACAKTDGLIGVNGLGLWLGEEKASATKLAEHIDYIAQLAGPKHVGLGTDIIYFFDVLDDFMEMNSIFYGQNYVRQKMGHPTWTSLQPEQIIEVIDPLLKRGYSDDVINDILGRNYLRIFNKK